MDFFDTETVQGGIASNKQFVQDGESRDDFPSRQQNTGKQNSVMQDLASQEQLVEGGVINLKLDTRNDIKESDSDAEVGHAPIQIVVQDLTTKE